MNRRKAKKLAALKSRQQTPPQAPAQTPPAPLTDKQQEIVDLKARFLDLYPQYGTIEATLHAIGLKSRTSFYGWLKDDARFKADFEEVKAVYIEKLEQEADRRAIEGVNKPVFYKGQLVTDSTGKPVVIKEYSDTLLIFRLKALAPEKYRERIDNKVDVRTPGAVALRVIYDDDRKANQRDSGTPETPASPAGEIPPEQGQA